MSKCFSDDPIDWCLYASLGLNELNNSEDTNQCKSFDSNAVIV